MAVNRSTMVRFGIIWEGSDSSDLEKIRASLLKHGRTVLSTATTQGDLHLLKDGFRVTHTPERA